MMCGRFVRAVPVQKIAEEFNIDPGDVKAEPEYNISPGGKILISGQRGPVPRFMFCRWGMPLPWRPEDGGRIINVRQETLAHKKVFDKALSDGRCLIYADGFYEWREGEKGKTPYFFRIKSGVLFAMAGIAADSGEMSCAIITIRSNSPVNRVHHRMPAILGKEDAHLWMDPHSGKIPYLLKILTPFSAFDMEYFAVSRMVNDPDPSYNKRKCIEPMEES